MKRRAVFALLAGATLAACGGGGDDLEPDQSRPIVIAHRGASGYLPEHTLGGYELAMRLGADYIEPDLQLTRDGALVAMHDETLERTTNVAALFPPRSGGYKVADFTLAEIKTLAVKPTGTGKASYPGFAPGSATPWSVPTFDEVIRLAQSSRSLVGREVGIYPEAKQADPAMEDAILKALVQGGYSARSRVFIQSFSDQTLRSMHVKAQAQGNPLPQILLGAAVMGADGVARLGVIGQAAQPVLLTFKDVASFAQGVGVVINASAYPITKAYIDQAHAVGLKVHGWTFAQPEAGAAAAEYRRYLELGMDGMFSNYPDLAVKARDQYVRERQADWGARGPAHPH
ncbi:glycerophosphodiester phosphodiesterase family protein [Pulveribacter suum]|uniref:GP-PDE domain-containing protein n=1 Tax=Pulveribacter suum TaxID=2116657 RepID=A0A2P1NJ72_9BURK|nr:glycerophosphodiester phosphodiesterase family protein [Pulveribacter suum]AVP57095.1 hypothetical protein C7H73_05065 [Pulveribacter suum]